MERKKVLRTQDKSAGLEPVGYDISTNLEQSNKTLPTGEVISIVDEGEQFIKERTESHLYRLTATLKPTVFYPQDFYWLGNPTGSLDDVDFDVTSSSQTSPFATNQYALPNLLNPTTDSPTEEEMRLDKTDNWVVQILQPFENEYLQLYSIPEFTVNVGFVPEPNDARYGIDTGIHSIIFDEISVYLDSNVDGITIDDWFNGSQHILQTPIDNLGDGIPGETLKISNQSFQGYTQDGTPFLFSIPVHIQQGWFTALYVPFEHNFEEGDYVFIKTVSSTGNIPGVGDTNDIDSTGDPSLYGFHRVIASSWSILGSKYEKHYLIIEHKSEYHDDWFNNTQGVQYPFTVESSQGFIKRIRAYSNESTPSLFVEPLLISTFTPQGTDEVLITSSTVIPGELELVPGDQVLITVSTEAPGTYLPNERRPLSFNMSGIYTVTSEPMGTATFTVRSREFQDNIAYFNGTYTFNTLPAGPNYVIEVSKFINASPSEYYLRKGKIITTINDVNVTQLPFSDGIYGDSNYSVVVENDIDIETLKDNHQRPVTQLYLATIKRAGQKPYDFTNVEAFFNWAFTQSSLIVKTGDGLEVVSQRSTVQTDPGFVRDITGGFIVNTGEYLGDTYYIDFSEYNLTTLEELKVESIKHRFNTFDRECENDNCNEEIMPLQSVNFPGWTTWAGSTCTPLTVTGGSPYGVQLQTVDSGTQPCSALSETSSTEGSFIAETFTVTADQVDEQMVLELEFTQETSTGVVRIIQPNGSILPLLGSTGVYPGDTTTLNGLPQTQTYIYNFTPNYIGDYTLLLGIMGWSGSWTNNTGYYTAYYDNVSISRYFGTPQYGAWIYDPFGEYTIKRFSQFLETADPTVLDIPYYATFVSGLYLWRDLLTLGFFEDIDRTQGVDYPFLNGKHYIDIDKHFLVGLTPYAVDSNTIGTIIFGCQDLTATNYLSYATVPCGPTQEQNGPCTYNLNGELQTLSTNPGAGEVTNLLGCCCEYDEGTTGVSSDESEKGLVYLTESYGADLYSENSIRYGDQNTGWNMCQGYFPYWSRAKYWEWNTMDAAYSVSATNWDFAGLRGVVTGVDTPAFRTPKSTGKVAYDIFRYENYVTGGILNLTFGVQYGDLVPDPTNAPNTPWYNDFKGRQETANDPDNLFKMIGGNNTSNPNQWSGKREQTIGWSSSETVTNNSGVSCTDTPFQMNTGYFYFYKFDTTNCNTCYDKGSGVYSPYGADILAPRHGWPVDVDSDGTTNSDYVTLADGTVIKSLQFYDNNYLVAQADRYQSVHCGGVHWGSAGLLEASTNGGWNTNIAAYRDESDPANWRFQYANMVHTWGCDEKTSWGDLPFGESAAQVTPGGTSPIESMVQTAFFNCAAQDASTFGRTEKVTACLYPTVGKFGDGSPSLDSASWTTLGSTSSLINMYPPEIDQPTVFEPDLPNDGQTHNFEFRGRVNVEMAIAADGFETYYNSSDGMGWHLAATDLTSSIQSVAVRYNNNEVGVLPGACPSPCLDDAVDLAAELSNPGAWKNYTRLYSGFWIAVVDHDAKVTYIYDADDGTAGEGVATVVGLPVYQSDGDYNFSNVPWYHECGGFDYYGNPVATKMSYSPCRDGTFTNAECTTGYNGSNNNAKKDKVFADGDYLPSCGESGTSGSSNVGDFQKQWSQSFRSGPIPMKKGDQAFIYIRSVGGTSRAVNTFNPSGWSKDTSGNPPQGLPSYWAVRQLD